jgi:hypothetical protein
VSKADYVRAAITEGRARGHVCHWPGCARSTAPAAWGCREHWYKLPLALRNKIWASYRPGQEISKTPSRNYIEVAREVEAWILKHHGPPTHRWEYDL